MKTQFRKYIKAVGIGKKHNRDLTYEEINDLFELIFNQQVFNEQISAFLLGWRVKPETVEEFIAARDCFDRYIVQNKVDNSIEFGYPYDGKCNNPYLFPLIAKELQKFKQNIVLTGDKLQPSKEGITVKQIINNIPKIANIHYFDREEIFPQLSNLTTTRQRLGIRTGLNTIEKLLNPALSHTALLGVFHKPFMEKYVKIFANRYKQLIIIKGNEGTSDIFSKTQFWIAKNDKITEYKIDPKDYGINYTKSWDSITLEESINMINNPPKQLVNLAKLNCAVILFGQDYTSSIDEAYSILS